MPALNGPVATAERGLGDVAQLGNIVTRIRGAALAIESASGELAIANLDLSRRTESQASSLEETAAAMEVLAATVRQNTENAAAVGDIKRLVVKAGDSVAADSRLVGGAARTVHEVEDAVREVSTLMSDITAATREQSTGLGQVNTAVMQMDQTTQRNAALVEQAAAAASLREQAASLSEAVVVFRMQGGEPPVVRAA